MVLYKLTFLLTVHITFVVGCGDQVSHDVNERTSGVFQNENQPNGITGIDAESKHNSGISSKHFDEANDDLNSSDIKVQVQENLNKEGQTIEATQPHKITSLAAGFQWLGDEQPQIGSRYKAIKTNSRLESDTLIIQHAGLRTDRNDCLLYVQTYTKNGVYNNPGNMMCPDSTWNRYGIKVCQNMQERFLGQKDLGGFAGAFGVEVICTGKSDPKQSEYVTQPGDGEYSYKYELWYHKDSHHGRKLIRKLSASCKNYFHYTNSEYEKCLTNMQDGKYEYDLTFENLEPSFENIPTAPPISSWVTFSALTTSFKVPGDYRSGEVTCFFNESKNTVEFIILPHLKIIGNPEQGKSLGYLVTTTLAPSENPTGAGTFTFSTFKNTNWWGQQFAGFTTTVKEVIPQKYYEVHVSGTVNMWNAFNKNYLLLKSQVKMDTAFGCPIYQVKYKSGNFSPAMPTVYFFD